ncbi:14772_t:CDS:2 [Funneliformis geosporum]|uniref:COX assembly mitochondrial protein n=1 Tax=Funneliformis geosporum TaxID=1117311 RepID=A0A9W4T2R3_9GLOM|nr:14772_t:CDS:2 [Funneliformis geosporum]
MHPNLALHKHPKCVDIILRLDECHKSGFFKKYFGGCNELKRELNECLTLEFNEIRKKNADKAKEQRKKVEELWKEFKE